MQQHISQIESGQRKFLPDDYIPKLCELGGDLHYIVHGTSANTFTVGEPGVQYKRAGIPLVNSKAVAGYLDNYLEPEYISELPTIVIPGARHHNGTFCAFEVSGNSMSPTLLDGDIVITEKVEGFASLPRRTGVYVVVTNETILAKRLIGPITGTALELRSDNADYPEIHLSLESINQLWFVTSIITSMYGRESGTAEIRSVNDRISRLEVMMDQIIHVGLKSNRGETE